MKKFAYFLFFAVIILFTACKDDDNNGHEIQEDANLQGAVTEDRTLVASVAYQLTGALSVKNGATLTIPAGTTIKSNKGFSNYIIVEQGGKININGTADKPVKMTSGEVNPSAGDWGGLIINGYAPISGATTGTTSATEIDSNLPYGGNKVDDNSGSITYLIIEYPGARSTADIEHNGLTLNGVGNGTKIENIYILESSDDGIEFFGGSVNVTNLLVINSDDDMFDATQGWSGTLNNAYGEWKSGFTSTEADPRGVEADGNFDGNGPTHVGQSDFKISNMTIVNNSDFEMQDAIKIRRGAKATITNALVKGSGKVTDLVDLTDSKGDGTTTTSIKVSYTGITLGSQIKQPAAGNADITVAAGNTGADTSKFSWTGVSL